MKGKSNFRLKIIALLLVAAVVFFVVKYFRQNIDLEQVLAAIERLGFWAPVFYILVYILISGVVIPSIIIKIFAGTLFGVIGGTVLASIAATISSSIKFIFARYLFRESILKKVEKNNNLKAIDQVIERDGWKMLMILRNVPVLNSMLLNYICGLTRMKFKHFALASFIGRLPTTVMYVYLGYIVRYTYRAKPAIGSGHYLVLEKIVLFIGLAAAIAASFYLIHVSKKVLAQKAPAIATPPLKN